MAKTKYIGSKEFIDPTTGELVPMQLTEIDTQGRRNFFICYMYNYMKLIDAFGCQKYKVLEFIIDNMNNDNQLIMTINELSQKSGISQKTISRTLKIMEDNNLIVRKVGCIMLNPKLFNNKSPQKEQYMVIKYNQIKKDNATNNDNVTNNDD